MKPLAVMLLAMLSLSCSVHSSTAKAETKFLSASAAGRPESVAYVKPCVERYHGK